MMYSHHAHDPPAFSTSAASVQSGARMQQRRQDVRGRKRFTEILRSSVLLRRFAGRCFKRIAVGGVRMRRIEALVVGCVGLSMCGGLAARAAPPVEACATNGDGIGMSRIVEVDTRGAPVFGRVASGGYDFLADGEVVLTFDDGP